MQPLRQLHKDTVIVQNSHTQYLNKNGSIPKENTPLYLYKQVAVWTWSMSHSLPTPGLRNYSRKKNYGLVIIHLPKVY